MSARRWCAAVLAPVIATTVLLGTAACARPDLAGDRARALQGDVLAVTQASAQGRYDAATALLDRLRVEVEDGRAHGEISADRYATIDAALDEVATELAAAAAAQAAQEAAVQAAAAQAAADAARAEATAQAEQATAAAKAEADAALAEANAKAAVARDAAKPKGPGGPAGEEPKKGPKKAGEP